MNYEQFLAELARACLSIRAFADLIGMNPNSISNYAKSGTVPRHLAIIVALLAELKSRSIDFTPVVEKVIYQRKRPRGGSRPGKFGGDKQEQLELET